MNVELALQGIEDARRDLTRFNMINWVQGNDEIVKESEDATFPCGTTACYAGHVSLRAAPVGTRLRGPWLDLPDGTNEHVETYAIEALDITRSQAWSLFYLHDIDQVETAVRYLADNPDADEEALDRAAGVDIWDDL